MEISNLNLFAARGSLKKLFGGLIVALSLSLFSALALAEKINLNSADAETLQYIPGIGPAKSIDIIEHRTANKGFKSMEDLLAVPGIGQKTLDVIQQHGALDSGVSELTEEMRNNPPSATTKASG